MREAVGPEARIRVDANAAGTSATATRTLARAGGARHRAGRAAGGDAGGDGRSGGGDLDPDRRRRERREPRRRRARGRARRLRADRDQALQGRRAGGGDRDRRGAAVLPLQRPRRPGRDRGGGAARADAERERRGGSLDLAHGLATQRLFSATIAAVECELRDGMLHLPAGPASASRSTSARSTRTGFSLLATFRRIGRQTRHAAVDPTNANTALASAFVEELARGGLRHAVVSPGSRSTPLALALWRAPEIEVTVIVDERSAAFFALGAAQASGAPVALLCTSGTAAANYHPAVCEADESAAAAGRPQRRPAAGAARDRRRADDRPDQALRLLGALVLRSRDPRGRRRRAAPLPLGRLPGAGRGPRRDPARPGPPQPALARAAGADPGRGRGDRDRPAGARGPRRATADRGDPDRPRALGRSCSRRWPATSATRSPA